MDPLEIARWQFGITTVYHFVMVPLTLGLGPLVVFMQAMWLKTEDEKWLRMTKFWGKLFLINFIMGVATGIVQEFQFGMAWSEYSRFVGDVFGAPLAMEALIAFFLESTFLGIWIFGWGRLKKGLHFAVLLIAVCGSWLSAVFIIVANSWMQHPVGVELVDGRPVMNDIWAVLTNNTALVALPHVLTGAVGVGAAILVGIAWYQLWQRRRDGIDTVDARGRVVVGSRADIPGRDTKDHAVWLTSLRVSAVVAIVAFAGVAISGDFQAKLMFEQQPMKMAAAEGACEDTADLSLLTIGAFNSDLQHDCTQVTTFLVIPGALSFLANGTWDTAVPGIETLVPIYQENYGETLPDDEILGERAGAEIDYVPNMFVTYWGFRMMIGFGILAAGFAALALFLTRKGTVPAPRWMMWVAVASIAAPFAANIAGWVFTEMGRQPFVVAPNPTGIDGVWQFTAAAVSPGINGFEVVFSLVSLGLVYLALLVVELTLIVRTVRGGVAGVMPGHFDEPDDPDGSGGAGGKSDSDTLAFAY